MRRVETPRMFPVLFSLLVVMGGIVMSGCARHATRQNSLVGKWQMTADNGYGANMMDFTKDGKFMQSTLMQDAGQVFVEGTYAVDGDQLSLTPTKATAVNPQFQAQVEAIAMQPSRVHLQWEHFGMVRFLVNDTRAAELHKLH